jgi:hypothetical protein
MDVVRCPDELTGLVLKIDGRRALVHSACFEPRWVEVDTVAVLPPVPHPDDTLSAEIARVEADRQRHKLRWGDSIRSEPLEKGKDPRPEKRASESSFKK